MQAKFCIKDWCCNYANKKEQTTIYWNTARVSDITSMEIQKTEIKQTIANRRYTIISVGSGTLKGFRVSISRFRKTQKKPEFMICVCRSQAKTFPRDYSFDLRLL